MLCQRCNQKEATIHITQISNGMLRELHLCSECAGRQFMPDMLTGKQLLEQLMQNQRMLDIRCPACGTTLSDFQHTGYIGCPHCYEVFRQQMEPMLLAVHGVTRHSKQYVHAETKKEQVEDQGILQLREELNSAIREERYEQAAELRDKLKILEREGSR